MVYVPTNDMVYFWKLAKMFFEVFCVIVPPFIIWGIWKRTNSKKVELIKNSGVKG